LLVYVFYSLHNIIAVDTVVMSCLVISIFVICC